MQHSDRPILIIGAGLSGLTIAYRLIAKNKRVIVYDNGVNHSSLVAAGMINPLVFRRMNKSWRLDACMDALLSFYPEIEAKTNTTILHKISIRRLFSSEQERDLWHKHQELEAFERYMVKTTPEDAQYNEVLNPFGSGRVKNASYIDTKTFLNALKTFVAEHGEIRTETFDASAIQGDQYQDVSFESVVFCEGYKNIENPFFGNYPVEQTKGETLTIEAQTLPETESVNRKCFVLPLGDHQFRIGSTYVWNTPDLSPTEEGKAQILEHLSYLTTEKVTVVDHGAGIRPTTRDRRPIIGRHPNHPNLYIFNGLGAKGYMLAPLLSQEFVAYLLENEPLDKEVDIARFNR